MFGLDIVNSIISTLGCIGNVFTMLIISKWDNISSGAAFMFALALTDLMAVFYDGIIDCLLPLFGFSLRSVNSILCAFCTFFSWITTLMSFYMTVLFSLDKCLAVVFPFKYRRYGKVKVCVIMTILIYVIGSLWTSAALLVFRIHPESGVCRPMKFEIISRHFFFEIRPNIGFILAGIMPIVFVIFLLSVTILKIRFNARKRNEGKNKQSPHSRRDLELTRQMIVVAIVFTVLTSINAAIYIRNFSTDAQTAEENATTALLDSILSIDLALINSANFYLYLIFGKKFRASFLMLFGIEKDAKKSKNQQSAATETNKNWSKLTKNRA